MRLLVLLTPLVLAACALSADPTPEALRSLPAGAWQLEKPHASLIFRATSATVSEGEHVRIGPWHSSLDRRK